jgi:hypothetical protein
MRLPFCAACGSTDHLQHHHLVTRGEGGGNDETNLITLCHGCHAKLHERRFNGIHSASQRAKAGLQAAKAHGKSRADPDAFAARVKPMVAALRAEGLSLRAIAARLTAQGVSTLRGGRWEAAQVHKVLLRGGQRS